MNDDSATQSREIGLDPTQTNSASIWVCPEVNNGLASLNTTPVPHQWQIGYQYLGGVTNWYNAATGGSPIPSLSPVKLSRSKARWVLATEDIVYDGSTWSKPHKKIKSPYPSGGNELTADGSVTWVKIEMMYQITSYDIATRQWYFYQDDLSVMTSAQLAQIKFKP